MSRYMTKCIISAEVISNNQNFCIMGKGNRTKINFQTLSYPKRLNRPLSYLQTAFLLYILAEGGDILKHEDFGLYAGACGSRKTIVRFLSAHRASLLTACWLKSCRAFYVCVGFSESLRICLQSSYSRPCGWNRWLPTDRREVGKCRFLIYSTEGR